jgi:septal ring factor EnvC (AmiA/AmiB activator)
VHGIDPGLTWLWPLLLDFAMIVFSLAVLRTNLSGESSVYPWILTGAYAGLATVANILDVSDLSIPPQVIAGAVKALAPISLVLAFELLMGMIKAELKRANIIKSMAELRAEGEQVRQDQEAHQQEQLAELSRLAAEREKMTGDITAEREHLNTVIAALEQKKAGLETEITELQKAKREAKQQALEITDNTRERARLILAERPDISGTELGRELGKSDSLGRKLKREISDNGHIQEAVTA